MNRKYEVPIGILVAALGVAIVVLVLVVMRLAAGPLKAGEMPEFKLVRTFKTEWFVNGKICRVPTQSWRHIETGAWLEVEFASFSSNDVAAAACQAQLTQTAEMPRVGSFSGSAIGDQCWHWGGRPQGRSGRLLFRSGSLAVSIHMVGAHLVEDVTTLLEDVACRILRNIRKNGISDPRAEDPYI